MFLKKTLIYLLFLKINKYKYYLCHIWIPGGYFLYLISLNIFFLSRRHFHEGKPKNNASYKTD